MLALRDGLTEVLDRIAEGYEPLAVGQMIGSSNRRSQPFARRSPVGLHPLAAVKARAFLSGPRLLIAPRLEIGFRPLPRTRAR
jgi:hypothetical protein